MSNTLKYIKDKTDVLEIGQGEMRVTCHYPENNPEDAVEDVTRSLEYMGGFDGLNK